MPRKYVQLDEPTEAFESCLFLLEKVPPGHREISRTYYWSEQEGALVEVVLEAEGRAGKLFSTTQCRWGLDGNVELITFAGRS